jgi:hypothetical protein
MVELPKTEAELQAYVDAQVQAQKTEWESKQNEMFASQRKKHQAEIDKIKADMGKSAEELAQERIKEQQEKDSQELADLRAYKKSNELGRRLEKEGLPSYFKNDSRLLNAEDGDIEKVIKTVKKEYEDSLPKGNQYSTIIKTQSGQVPEADKDKAKREFGESLKALVGK